MADHVSLGLGAYFCKELVVLPCLVEVVAFLTVLVALAMPFATRRISTAIPFATRRISKASFALLASLAALNEI